jgi:hypothetical protein
VAARPTALINCGSSVAQPFGSRGGVPRSDLVLEEGSRNAPQTSGSMQLVKIRAVLIALALRVGRIALKVALALIIELFFEHRGCCGSRRGSLPLAFRRRQPAIAVPHSEPPRSSRGAIHARSARSPIFLKSVQKEKPISCLTHKGVKLVIVRRLANAPRRD